MTNRLNYLNYITGSWAAKIL